MAIAKLQEILDAVQTLPLSDRQTLREFLDNVAADNSNGVSEEMCAAEMRWLAKHEAEYAGQWVALDGDRLVAFGTDPKQLYAESRAVGVPNPFLAYAENPHQAQWGGW